MIAGQPEPNAVAAAVNWLSGLLTGPLISIIAIIAIASIGFLMLAGRVELRRSLRIILGCFIVFGASSIASGIMNAMAGSDVPPVSTATVATPPSYPVAVVPAPNAPSAFDPYSGAALPTRN